MNHARADILANIRSALGRTEKAPVATPPSSARVPPRTPGNKNAEIDQLMAEVGMLGAKTRRIASQEELRRALADMLADERITRATLCERPEITKLAIPSALEELGIALVPPHADRWALATCDLGITGVDGALPETGTLLLRSTPEQPRLVSLLPRVLLAILRPSALCADLHQALDGARDAGQFVLVTGPSRTADIELTLTIGVHGPGALYVWCVEDGIGG